MISFDELSAVLQHFNDSLFIRNFGSPVVAGGASAHYNTIPAPSLLDLLVCHDGANIMPTLEASISDPSHIQPKHVAVGHVLDMSSKDQKLPVVVAIGINYTQFGSLHQYPNLLVPTVDDTKTYGKVLLALSAYTGIKNGFQLPVKDKYHLVLTNIFPWITTTPWANLPIPAWNCVQESVMLARFGYRDPITELISLVFSISSHISAVIFHRAANCVPHYGVEFGERVVAMEISTFPTLLCDNLSPRTTRIWNVASLY
jgi:hypothetical protein